MESGETQALAILTGNGILVEASKEDDKGKCSTPFFDNMIVVDAFGIPGVMNKVAYFPPISKDREQVSNVILFPGDVQDFENEMQAHNVSRPYAENSFERTGALLQLRYPRSGIFLIRPARLIDHVYASYENFVICSGKDMGGAVRYNPNGTACKHLLALLEFTSDALQRIAGVKVKLQLPIELIGFSKGVLPLNQLVTELAEASLPEPRPVSRDPTLSALKNQVEPARPQSSRFCIPPASTCIPNEVEMMRTGGFLLIRERSEGSSIEAVADDQSEATFETHDYDGLLLETARDAANPGEAQDSAGLSSARHSQFENNQLARLTSSISDRAGSAHYYSSEENQLAILSSSTTDNAHPEDNQLARFSRSAAEQRRVSSTSFPGSFDSPFPFARPCSSKSGRRSRKGVSSPEHFGLETQSIVQLSDNVDESAKKLFSRIWAIHWLDGGNAGMKGSMPTNEEAVKALNFFRVKVAVHGTPWQWNDTRRPWLYSEHQDFIYLMKTCNVEHRRRMYFEDSPPALNKHFEILSVFEINPWSQPD